jgi:hypothetical protein
MSLLVDLVASKRFAQLALHSVEMLAPFEIGAIRGTAASSTLRGTMTIVGSLGE